jgi:uncharacterized membrane protein
MLAAGTVVHLLGALRRAIGRVILWFFLLLIVGGGVTELVAYFAVGRPSPYAPTPLAHITAAIIGLALGYAAALTVLVGEVIHFLVSSIRSAENEIKAEIGAPGKLIGAITQGVGNLEKRL